MYKMKKIIILCALFFVAIFMASADLPDENIEIADYETDGLLINEDEILNEENVLSSYENELDKYVTVENNRFVIDFESIENEKNIDNEVISALYENVEFVNELALEQPDIVEIEDDKSLSFNIEDEYAEQWNAWQSSYSFWKGWTYKLDSDFGKLVGIGGVAYRMMSYITNGAFFYKNIMNITDKDYLASTLASLFFYLPQAGVKDIIATYLQNYACAIASGLITINMTLMVLKHASLGTSWLIFKIVDFILSRVAPSLITSTSIVYNCFKYNSPIYCKISPWTAKISYSLTKF